MLGVNRIFVTTGTDREKSHRQPPGTPRQFDAKQALDHALDVFWRKGYEGASLADLTAAMGINRPSLYAAYGNKETLFRKALDRYVERIEPLFQEALGARTAREVAERLLYAAADGPTCPTLPRGCLFVVGAAVCSDEAGCARQELVRRRELSEAAIRERLVRAKQEGDLPSEADPEDLARFLTTVRHGLSLQATGGVGCEELRRVAATALRAWPAK